MKQLTTTLIVAAAAVLSNAAVANGLDTKSHPSIDIKCATPGQSAPAAEQEADPETELMLLGLPELENRPPR